MKKRKIRFNPVRNSSRKLKRLALVWTNETNNTALITQLDSKNTIRINKTTHDVWRSALSTQNGGPQCQRSPDVGPRLPAERSRRASATLRQPTTSRPPADGQGGGRREARHWAELLVKWEEEG
jgi:hypothetical protein